MLELPSHQPVDYLIVGHVAVDITPTGVQLGGTVSYSALTARALGLRVGIVTSSAADAPLQALDGIQIVNIPAEQSTTFENIKTESGRRQILHHQAVPILLEHIPQVWRTASIIHLAPIAGELDPSLAEQLSGKFLELLRKAGCAPGMKMVRWPPVFGKTANRLSVRRERW